MTYSPQTATFNNNIITSANNMNKENPVVIVIIPAYNESKYIGKVTAEAYKYATMVIVVDDGSNDNTAELAISMNARVIRNRLNMGKGIALKRGVVECLKFNPDIIVTLDADGQHNPADIPKLIEPIKKGKADIVIGSRYEEHSISEIPMIRGFGLSFINLINRSLMKSTIKDSQSGFRAYTKGALTMTSNYNSTGYGVETEQLATAELYGFQIVEVPVIIKYQGLENSSKKNSILVAMNIISTIFRIAVERRPLLFFGFAGIILIGAAVITTSQMLLLFNETRYFSIPLALITLGLSLMGTLVLLMSFIFHTLKRVREK
jgi:glycosyltransferase involved in cell wall biosynthesis